MSCLGKITVAVLRQMSNGYRKAAIATGLIVGLSIALSCADERPAHQVEQPSSQVSNIGPESDQSENAIRVRIANAPADTEADKRTESERAIRAEKHDADDLIAQREAASAASRSAYWGAWQTVIGMIGAVGLVASLGFTWLSLRQTAAAIAVERDMGERQTRAYVDISSVSAILSGERDRRFFKITIAAKNGGLTPAKNVTARHAWSAEPGEFNEAWLDELVYVDGSSTVAIGAEIRMAHITDAAEDAQDRLTADQISEILQGKRNLWVYGFIDYYDVFGEPRCSAFRFIAVRDYTAGHPESTIVFVPTLEGNKST